MTRGEAEEFLFTEARLLDERKLEDWLELTADDFMYWIPLNDEDSHPETHLSIIYDSKADCRERIFRVLESGMNHPQDPPSRTARFVTNVEVIDNSGSEAELRCNTLLYEYRSGSGRPDTTSPNIYPARCHYRLRKTGEDWRMTFKKVSFVTMDGPLNAMTFFI
jgi:benzoate/toluate 1,2-dioxygenase beta subunit